TRAFETAADTLRAVIGRTQALVQAARDGRLDARADAAAFDGGYRALVDGMNQTLDAVAAPIGEARAVLERVAARDLAARMTGSYAGEYATIKTALNRAVENLDGALGEVHHAAARVAAAGGQITE